MNQEQKTYLIKQMREHANWQLNNTRLTIPFIWTEVDIAHALNERGFIINQRPITDVDLPPTEEMVQNKARYDEYLLKVNALTGAYIDAIINGEKDNPASVLQEFIVDLAKVES